MAALQIDIMKIKQLILLKSKGLSNRKISLEISADRNTVNEYVRKLTSSKLSSEELLSLSEKDLQELFKEECVYMDTPINYTDETITTLVYARKE